MINEKRFYPESPEENSGTMDGGKDNKIEERGAPENQELRALLEREAKSLESFFGKKIEVPPLPEEITSEKYAELKERGFELHYLPAEELSEDRELPGWKVKPEHWFFDVMKPGFIPEDATSLPGSWVAVDERREIKDVLAPVLEQLRSKGVIQDRGAQGSRFNVSYNELHNKEVKEAFADLLGVNAKQIRLPRAIEYNYLGNVFYPAWDKEHELGGLAADESFEDIYLKGRGHLSGGSSGLAYVSWDGNDERGEDLVFRVMIAFPKIIKKKA